MPTDCSVLVTDRSGCHGVPTAAKGSDRMDTTRGRLPGRPAGTARRRGPLVRASVALAAAAVAGLTGCSTTADGANTPGVIVATSPAVSAPTASSRTTPAKVAPSPSTPSATATPSARDDSTPTTSSVPEVTGTQTQPPGAVRILPIKPSDRSPAAARAVDTAAAYLRAVAGVYRAGNTDAIKELSADTCANCTRDIRVLGGRIARGERIVDDGGLDTFKYVELKYLGSAQGRSQVSASVIEGPARLVDKAGRTLVRQQGDTTADYLFTINELSGRPEIQSLTVRSQ